MSKKILHSNRQSVLHLSKLPVVLAVIASLTIASCGKKNDEEPITRFAESDKVVRLIPVRVKDRKGWAKDMLSIMDEAKVPHTLENICSIVAIVDQESNFHADPAVAGLSQDAKKALFERIQDKLGDTGVDKFKAMLKSKPAPDENFMMQIDKIKTERDLDLLYRQMFDYFRDHYNLSLLTGAASLISGHDMKEYLNPIKTLGSMQVHVNFAFSHPHNSKKTDDIRDEMYTQYGGMYYGILRLMDYDAAYDKPIYRFADYNSGMYSSRNAAFQQVISKLSDIPLAYDGDLLSYDKDENALSQRSNTEIQIAMIARENNLGLSAANIRGDLLKEKEKNLEETETYKKINDIYLKEFNKAAAYAIMPQVVISGPKLSRDYNTNWYASRVNGRYLHCVSVGKRLRFSSEKLSDNDDE